MTAQPKSKWIELMEELGPAFARRATAHDEADRFVAQNYEELRARKAFLGAGPGRAGRRRGRAPRDVPGAAGAGAPLQFDGAGALDAPASGRRGGLEPSPRPAGRKLLEAVAGKELTLVSTGANDWLASSGEARRVDGGFRVSARKAFASGSPAGAVLVTSAPYEDPQEGAQVLHFPVPLSAEGARLEDDWRAMGMRGAGSHTVVLENVFVPEEAVVLRRPRGQYHGVWNVVLGVALPLIMSVYVGVAESCAALAVAEAKRRPADADPQLLGEMTNRLVAAQLAVDDMAALADDLGFEATADLADAMLVRKTLAADAVVATCAKALEATGGSGYFRAKGIERLLRDAYAGQFHPLPARKQQVFTGRRALGLEPVAS